MNWVRGRPWSVGVSQVFDDLPSSHFLWRLFGSWFFGLPFFFRFFRPWLMFFFIWDIIISSSFIMFFAIWDIVSSTYHYWIVGSSSWPAGTATMIALIVTLHSYSCPLGLAFISIISPILPAHRLMAATTWEKRESLESSSSKGRHSLRVLEVEEHCLHVFLQFFLIHGLHSGSFLSLQSLFCLSQYPDDTNSMYLQVYQFVPIWKRHFILKSYYQTCFWRWSTDDVV